MSESTIPKHIAIIPDGNRRWARAQKLEPWKGHESGARNIEKLARKAFDLGVECLSFWGSSINNLEKRPLTEKNELLRIYEEYFRKLITSEDIAKNETRINIFGRWRESFPQKLRSILEEGMENTRHHQKTILNFFLAYNGDDEMIEAVRRIAEERIPSARIGAATIKKYLMTKDLPAVNLLVRTGGDPHLSVGFMMWDIANAQLHFSEKHFPDFSENDLEAAIQDFARREQRGGK